MRHKIISGALALLFLVLIQMSRQVFRFLFAAVAFYTAAVLAYNYWYLRKRNFYSFWSWIRPLFLFAALMVFYLILPATLFKGLFMIFATALIFFVELNLDLISEQAIFLGTLFAYFGLSIGVFAAYFYFLPKSPLVLAALFLMTFLISRASLDYIPQTAAKKNFFSGLLALSLLEIGWALTLLPLHFTALAVMLFNSFYVLWIVVYYYLFNNINAKKISFHLIFSFLMILAAFLSTPWK